MHSSQITSITDRIFNVPNSNGRRFLPAGIASGYELPGRGTLLYLGPTPDVTRAALGTAAQGVLPNLPAPAPNASYTLDYHAPAVQCRAASLEILAGLNGILFGGRNASDNCQGRYNTTVGCHRYHYLGWVPGDSLEVPFQNSSQPENERNQSLTSWNETLPTLGPNRQHARIYAAWRNPSFSDDPSQVHQGWNVLNCSLYNATYTTAFNFTNNIQTIKVTNCALNEPITARIGSYDRDRNSTNDLSIWNNQAITHLLGQILVGSIYLRFTHTGSTWENPPQTAQTQIM